MDLLRPNDLHELLGDDGSPRASIYLPTHRAGPDTRQDPIRLKNLLRQTQEGLERAGLRNDEAGDVLKPATDLLEDFTFWQHQGDGLALFCGPGTFRSFRLPLAFDELVVVNTRFHVKPLLPMLTDGRFFLLALSQGETRLLTGSRQSVTTLHLDSIPRSLQDAMKYEEMDGFTRRAASLARQAAVFHGHGQAEDEHKDRILRYCRMIDQGLHEILRDERTPLLLAAVDYLHPIYREANTYPRLVADGIRGNPELLDAGDLHDRAWAILERHFADERRVAAARVEEALAKARATSDLTEAIAIAMQGRVDTLFVAAGEQRWGRWDADAGPVEPHDEQRQGDEDLLDLAVVQVLRMGGVVHSVPAAEVPGRGIVAASFRG